MDHLSAVVVLIVLTMAQSAVPVQVSGDAGCMAARSVLQTAVVRSTELVARAVGEQINPTEHKDAKVSEKVTHIRPAKKTISGPPADDDVKPPQDSSGEAVAMNGAPQTFFYQAPSKVRKVARMTKNGDDAPLQPAALHAAHSEISIKADSATGETERVETPFKWTKLENQHDSDFYKDTVQELCMESPDCPQGKPDFCGCLGASASCEWGTKDSYTQNFGKEYTGKVENITDSGSHIKLSFNMTITDCGLPAADSWRQCTRYGVGVGPYAVTNDLPVKVGDVAKFEFTAKEGNDYYEMFAGLYSRLRDKLVGYKFLRGKNKPWETFELPADQDDVFYVMFMLAGYDASNGCAVASEMQIRDVVVTKATPTPAPTPLPTLTPQPTPQPTPRPTPVPTLPSDATSKMCVEKTFIRKVRFMVLAGGVSRFISPAITKKNEWSCIDFATLGVVDGTVLEIPIFVTSTEVSRPLVTYYKDGSDYYSSCSKYGAFNWKCAKK